MLLTACGQLASRYGPLDRFICYSFEFNKIAPCLKIVGLTRPDVIEHMQNFVYDDLKRTLDEFPDCLDAPGNKMICP